MTTKLRKRAVSGWELTNECHRFTIPYDVSPPFDPASAGAHADLKATPPGILSCMNVPASAGGRTDLKVTRFLRRISQCQPLAKLFIGTPLAFMSPGYVIEAR